MGQQPPWGLPLSPANAIALGSEAASLAALACRIYDHAPQPNADSLGCTPEERVMKTATTVVVIGALAGFAILGAEATFLRILPTHAHALLALATGIVAAIVSTILRSRLGLLRQGQ
jgi:hypothetical protein